MYFLRVLATLRFKKFLSSFDPARYAAGGAADLKLEFELWVAGLGLQVEHSLPGCAGSGLPGCLSVSTTEKKQAGMPVTRTGRDAYVPLQVSPPVCSSKARRWWRR